MFAASTCINLRLQGSMGCRVMMIVAQEQAEEVQKREARRLEARKQQAQAALEHSKLRGLRARRLSGLKVCALQRRASAA